VADRLGGVAFPQADRAADVSRTESENMFPIGALAASIVGVIALAIDVAIMIFSGETVTPRFAGVFIAADVVGFSFGLGAGHSITGRAGLHLSWVPLLAVLVVAGAFRPEISIALIGSIGGIMFHVANGLATIVHGVFS
jgi:hypothetical protein